MLEPVEVVKLLPDLNQFVLQLSPNRGARLQTVSPQPQQAPDFPECESQTLDAADKS
jgi:hypothetical protein